MLSLRSKIWKWLAELIRLSGTGMVKYLNLCNINYYIWNSVCVCGNAPVSGKGQQALELLFLLPESVPEIGISLSSSFLYSMLLPGLQTRLHSSCPYLTQWTSKFNIKKETLSKLLTTLSWYKALSGWRNKGVVHENMTGVSSSLSWVSCNTWASHFSSDYHRNAMNATALGGWWFLHESQGKELAPARSVLYIDTTAAPCSSAGSEPQVSHVAPCRQLRAAVGWLLAGHCVCTRHSHWCEGCLSRCPRPPQQRSRRS